MNYIPQQENGRDEDATAVLNGQKRRGSVTQVQYLLGSGRPFRVPVPDFRPALTYRPRWPERSRPEDAAPRRYAHRPGKLTPAEESAIRALAGTKSLRSLAADFGVSHETIRAIIQRVRKSI